MSKAKVQRFLGMINQPTTDESVTEFLTKLTSPFDAAYFTGLYEALPEFPDDQTGQMEKKGGGSFGEFFVCKVDGKRCYKIINISKQLFSLFKELFIQYFLAQDVFARMHIPAIRAIYRKSQGHKKFVIVEMDRMDLSLHNLFATITAKGGQISFATFYRLLKTIFLIIKYLNERYRFVHRDLKTDNIMLKILPSEDLTIYIIDFGASCLTVNVDGTDYKIKALGAYRDASPCIPQQDVSVFLMTIRDTLQRRNLLEPDIIAFINSILIPQYDAYITARVATPDKIYTGHPFFASYNLYGNMFTNPDYIDLEESLDLDRVLTELDRKATQLGLPILGFDGPAADGGGGAAYGGRRRTRHKRRKTKSRRR